jgi:hypothetical protein
MNMNINNIIGDLMNRTEQIKKANKENRKIYHLRTEYYLAKYAPGTFNLLGELFY